MKLNAKLVPARSRPAYARICKAAQGEESGGFARAPFRALQSMPGLRGAARGCGTGSGGNTYHINITAPPGGNAQDIARLVRDEIERLEHHRRVRHRSEMSDYE